MSWMQRLYETYESCRESGAVGIYADDQPILLPVAHTLLRAHITVTLSIDGAFVKAVVSDGDPDTIAPCTEDSDSRTSKPEPHPLFDRLDYLAGDYGVYVEDDDKKKKKAKKDAQGPYALYLKQLHDWAHSDCSHPQIRAIHAYIAKGTLMADLVRAGVVLTGADGMALSKWTGDKDDAPPLYDIKNLDPLKAVVRFIVLGSGGLESRVWRNAQVQDAFIRYAFQGKEERLCYVTGEVAPSISKHPKKIVNILGNAKLISANDNDGFTYRGRFSKGEQAMSVSYAASHKAHNALRWLIERQAFRNGEQTILAWSTGGVRNVPQPTCDSDELSAEHMDGGELDERTESDAYIAASALTSHTFAQNLSAALLGYRYDLSNEVPIVVMALDCATSGRLSITYYRELMPCEYLERIERWHTECAWLHTYKREDIEGEKYKKRVIIFEGAPSHKDIAYAAYGARADKRLVANTVKRLLPCVFDGAALPPDIVASAVRKASNPVSMKEWEWNKTLSIACSLYKKRHIEHEGIKGDKIVALERDRRDRSYLFGRLLAVADQIEKAAYIKTDTKFRTTNALRYMNAFTKKPIRTWTTIHDNLLPYMANLGKDVHFYEREISQISSLFKTGDFLPDEDCGTIDDAPLDGLHLLGFYCQRQWYIDSIMENKARKEAAKQGVTADKTDDGGMDNEP